MRRVWLSLILLSWLPACDCSGNGLFCFFPVRARPGVVPSDALIPAVAPSVSVSADGAALVSWNDEGAVMAQSYRAASGWSQTVSVHAGGEHATNVKTALVGTQQFVAFEAGERVYRSHTELDTSWPAATTMDQNLELDGQLNLASSTFGQGAVFTVWRKRLGDALAPFAGTITNHYLPAGGWQANTRIDTNPQQRSTRPQSNFAPIVAVDGRNRAWAAWSQTETADASFVSGVVLARYSGSNWEDATLFSFGSSSASTPAMAFDKIGDGVFVWQQDMALWESSFDDASQTWTTPTQLSPVGSSTVIHAVVAMNGAGGDAVAVWATATQELWSARFENNAWQTPTRFGTGTRPQVGIDADGAARAVWMAGSTVFAALLPASRSSWQPPEQLGTAEAAPDIAMNEAGFAVAAWHDGALQTHIWTKSTRTLTFAFTGTGNGLYFSPATQEVACTEACTLSFPDGAVVEFTAAASTGSVLGNLVCDGTVTDATCRITMDGDKTISARFDRAPSSGQVTLTVQFAGGGSGSVHMISGEIRCDGPTSCTYQFPVGFEIDFTGVPDTGSFFSHWEGCGGTSPGQNPCSLVLTENTTVVAHFE